MAFVEEEDVMHLNEQLLIELATEFAPDRPFTAPFPRITYADCMERFGTDCPDLRYDLELHDLTDYVRDSEFQVFSGAIAAGGRVRGFAVPDGADISRSDVDRLTDMARGTGAKGLVWIQFTGEGPLDLITEDDVKSPVSRFFSPADLVEIGKACDAKRGDMLLISADSDAITARTLDTLRRHVAEQRGFADPDRLDFLWVTEFPLLEWDEDDERWSATHHLFTAPMTEDLDLLKTDPGKVRSRAYDVVCNGQEIGGGSIRIHRRDTQIEIMALLGLSPEEAQLKFAHMLDAFEYGAPPHGGIAWGMDRAVTLLAGESDIREVIAFPKTKSAVDPLTGAPTPVTAQQLGDVHVDITDAAREHLASTAGHDFGDDDEV